MKKSLISVVSLMLLASITVANAQIQMTFSTVQPTCHGFTNGSATVFPIGGAGGYTYFWSTNQTTQTTFGIGMGTYTVTVTDAVQNTASGQISVSEPTAVTASITAGNLSCSGNSGQLTASGFGGAPPYSYAWDGPGGPSSFRFMQVVAPGNYFVTVTDANNCSGVSSFNVPTALSVEVTATDIPCSTLPQGGSANVVATGGVAPYVYNWSNGEHTTQINNLSQGPYFCTVTSANGCVGIDSDNVDIPAPLVVVITWLSPSCGFSNNGQATVQASGGTPPYVYNWPSPLPSGPSQTGLAPGLYYVCTFDSNMCQNDLWVNIPHITGLNVQLVVNSATCLGIDNASATAVVNPAGSNYVYQWNILPPDSNVVQLTGLAAGTFISVTVTDTLSGCTGTASGIVGAHSNINLAVTDIDILCAGGFGSATALASNGTPPYSYTWYSDTIKIGDTPSIGGLNPGAYLVTVEDFLGCQAQAVADISIQSAPNALIGPASVLLCGDSLSIVQFTNESTDPYNVIATLEWTVTHNGVDTTINQLNQITLPLPVDDTITVRLIVTSGLGCKDTAMLFYNVPGYPHFTISLDSATLNCTGDSIKINVINGDTTYNYVWSPAVTPNPNPLHVLVYPTTTTTYVLTVTDGNACTAVDSITIVPAAGFELFVAEKIIKTCGDSAMLFAYTIPSNILIIWFQGNDTLIGNPVKVPASSTTTIYTVKAFASDTCYLMEQVSVTSYDLEISIDPDAETSVCEGDSLLLSVIVNPASDSLSYLWSVNAPGILTTPTLANPILSGPVGVYTVTVIVTNVICADTLSFQVEILPGLNFPGQVTADLCNGLEVQFFNNVSGTWDFGDNSGLDTTMNPVHTYTASGQYRVIFTADLQCASPWDSTITVFDSVLTAGITHLYINCSTEALVQLNGSANHAGNNTWDWTFPNGTPATSTVQNPTVTYNNEGIYTATLVVTDINGCTATATDTIIVEIINDFIPNPAPICPGDCVQLNPDGFDLGANYSWTSVPVDSTLFGQENIPNPTVCPLVPTIYTANVSTGLCTVKYSVLVTFKQGGIVILPDDMIVCSNDSVSITALSNGATMFEWSINDTFVPIFATTQTVTVQPPGTFYVRTKGTECTAVDSIHIGLSQLDLLITQITNIVCEGDFGSATALASNGTPPYTYIWFNDVPLPIGNNASITGLSAGTYTVLATDSVGCTTIDTVNITVLSAPNALMDSAYVLECGESLSTVRFISLSSDAFDQIDSLKWIITGPGINVVILQQDTVDIQLPVGDTITVTLIATSSLGCSDTTSLEFLVPGIPDFSISLDSTSLNCNGGPLTLIVDGDPDYDYSWEPAVTIIGPLHVLVNPTVPTTYVLTATDGGVCTAVDSIRVTPVDGSFQLIVLDSIIQTCDTTVTLFASTIPAGIATIVWCKGLTPIGGNPIVVPATSTPTIYTVKAITADSCFRMDQVVVQGYGADVELDPNAETTVCEDESLTLSVIATPLSVTYFWTVTAPGVLDSPISAHPVLSGPPGVYTVKVIVTDVICSDSLEFQVEILEGGDLEGQISIDLCKGLEVSFTNPNNIGGTWNFGDGSQTSIEINPIHIYGMADQYHVTFTPDVLLKCIAPWDSIITVFDSVLTAGITHSFLECVTDAIIQFNGTANHAGNNTWDWTFPNGAPDNSTAQDPIVSYDDEGTYTATLVVTDINGCTATATDTIRVEIVNDTLPNPALICPGNCVQLNPDSIYLGANYHWTSVPFDSTLVGQENLLNPTVCPLVPTTYTANISQGICSLVDSVRIAFKNLDLAIEQIANIVCEGDFGSATALASNGTPPYTYDWFNDIPLQIGNNASIIGLTVGTYTVLATDGVGCTAIDTVNITVLSAPNALIDSVYVLECGESLSTVRFISLSSDSFDQIDSLKWIITGPVTNVVILQQDTVDIQLPVGDTIMVTLIVTSSLGCSDTTSLEFLVPGIPDFSISLDSTSLNCNGGPLTLIVDGDPDYDYSWEPAVTIIGPLHVLVNPTVPTTYVLTATDGGVCTAVDSIRVTPVDGSFQLIVLDSIIQTCDSMVTLFASTIPAGIATIVWCKGDSIIGGNPIVVPATSTPTIYTVKAITADSCFRMDQVVVQGYGADVELDPNAETTVCEDESLTLSVIATPLSVTYYWTVSAPGVLDSPISAHPVLSGPPGVYTVKVVVTDVICSDSLEFQVEILEGGDLEGQISIDLCKGLEVGFTNPNNIGGTWNFGDGSQTSIEINPIHIYGMADQYHVTFTPDVLLPCIALWDSTITVFDSVLTAGITHSYLECETKAIIQFNGSSNHAGNNTWDWTFPNGTPNNSTAQDPIVSYDDEGTYTATLVVTDINGCTATATDTVRVEIVNDTLPNPDPICPGDCVQLNPDGFDFGANYHWTSVPFDSTLIGQENIPNPTVCPLVPTIYTANISQGFCAIDLAVLVTFKQGGILTLPDDWVVCSDDSVSITALSNGATMFEWSIHANFDPIFATTQTVTVQPPGTFYVRTKGAECAAMDSVHIEIGEIEIEIVQIADIVCEGDFGTANALASNGTPPYTYTWFNNVPLPIGNNASIAGLTAGTYTVLATDGVGCTAIDTVNITVLSAPNALIDSVYVLECGDNLSTVRLISLSSDAFDQIDSLKWIFSGPVTNIVILQQDTVDIQLPVGDTIMVTLIVTSSLGCSDTTSLEFLVPGIPDFSISLDSTTLNCNGGPLTLIVNGDPDYDYSWEPAVTIIDSLHVSVNPTVPTTYVLTATDGGVCTAVDSIRVTPIDDDFQLIVLDSIIQTCDSTVTLFASTIPAGIATTIVWCQGNTPIGGNPIVVPVTSTPTIYTVKAITADSCFRMDQVVVQGYGVDVELDPNAETTVCEDESLTLSVIATPISVTYFWTVTAPGVLDSPFSAHPVLSGPPGVYNVKVIVTNVICFDSLEFQVEILEDGDLEGQISIDLCKGLEVGFTNPNNIGGTWNFGDGQVSIEIDPIHIYGSAGQYQVTFSPDTLLTCIAPWDSTITVFDSVLTAGITHLYVKCATEALVQFNGIANHAGNNTWSWTFPNGTPTTSTDQNQAVTYTDEGTYTATLVVTDINGCTATASYSFIVNILNDIIVDSLQICLGDCVQLNPDGFDLGANYQWTSVPFDSTLVGQENLPNPMVCPLVPTLYSVLISKGDCTVSYSVVVTFKPGSDVHIVPDPAASVCSMDLWTLTAQSNNATAFEWSSIRNFDPPFSDSQSVQVLPNGTYYVRTRGAECTAMDSIVIVLKIPEIQILPADYELCLGEQAALMFTNLISTDILTCDWGPNLPMDCNLIVSPSETSTYTVTVTNQYGCKDTLSFTVTVNMASVDAVADPNLVTAENPTSILTATPGGTGTIISYTWTPSGTLSSPNTAVTEASPTETTTYTVTVINSDGCLALDTVTVFVKPNNCISPFVFIPKAFTPNNDEKNDYFVPRADGMTALKFVVWDRWGEIVFETYDPNTLGWDGSFKGKTATPDAYAWYVRLTCGNGDIYEDRGNVTLLK